MNEQLMREQEFFWQRFYAFATLHAGAFVLVTSKDFFKPVVAGLALVLGLLWLYVQWASLHYLDRWKQPCYERYPKFDISYDASGRFGRWMGRRTWASSTNAAWSVTWGICATWVLVLCKSLG